MKPKTKLQVEVWNLHQRLNNPKEQEPYVISKHNFYYTTHYKSLVCLECNHNWKPTQVWHEELLGVECPSCKKKLKKLTTQNGGIAAQILTYSVTQVIGRFQLFRYFSCWKHMHKNKPPRYSFRSLFEEWNDCDKKKRVIVGRTTGWTGDGFNSTDYEIRNPTSGGWSRSYKGSQYDSFFSDYNCPGAEILPKFKKYGLTAYKHDCDYRVLINKLDRAPILETLLKARQKELLNYALHKQTKHHEFWAQIKIVIRNKYKIKDAGIWYDYLELLSYFNKDLHNPKYVCPTNLDKEHDRLVKKKNIILEAQERERNRVEVIKRQQKLEKVIIEYSERCQKFFDLEFTKGNISIAMLKSIDEFKQEGDELGHCVFTNEYYLKEKSLIFSAKVNGKRTETIEIKMPELTIVQSRGINNKSTDYHNKIVSLIKSNLAKIKSKMDPEKQKKYKKLKEVS
ncbi:PcfJ domain-containing protein [Flavobacterium crassostreae]|uniref:PcfJ-like protein n=1 Tax=Flavobacterium crassostreae TaxID=1763534 RepID=A0A1B9E7Q1_9FLAO|nr:PcfJ domain-containing protein [Flavobacterium crassostreae]OCB77987.1 hypothetical protein LPBF_03295 [Flavobacterium crassostreae]